MYVKEVRNRRREFGLPCTKRRSRKAGTRTFTDSAILLMFFRFSFALPVECKEAFDTLSLSIHRVRKAGDYMLQIGGVHSLLFWLVD